MYFSTWVLERRGSVIMGREVVTDVIPGRSAYEGQLGEQVVEGDPTGVVLAPKETGPMSGDVFGGFRFDEVAGLPTDPDELIAAVSARAGSEPDTPETAAALATLAAIPEMPPSLRAAALRALGSLATVDPVEGTDPLGRPGTVVSGHGWALIVDDPTGQVLAFATDPSTANPSAPGDAAAWAVWR